MIKGFWENLKKPIMILAPMEDVTDNAFREIIAKYGRPDVFYTEFTSADGLMSEGRERIIHRLEYQEAQRPIVAQIFTRHPDKMYEAAILCRELGFDGIDINMGCPDKNVCKQGAGASMIKEPLLAKKVIKEAMRGAWDIPVSVKTRLGYSSKSEMDDWIKNLLETEVINITLHARTKKEMSKVPADWNYILKAVEIRNSAKSETMIFGNGDVSTIEDAYDKAATYKADGIMVGRGIFGNPWFFNISIKKEDLSIEVRLKVLVEHTKLYDKYYKGRKNFHYMRKFFKSYISGIEDTKNLKMDLMTAENSDQVNKIVGNYLNGEKK
jgi:nifR3 family TIM-barrel protein